MKPWKLGVLIILMTIALIMMNLPKSHANGFEALIYTIAKKAAENLVNPPKVEEKKPEPFAVNGLFIGQSYKAAQKVLKDDIHTSAWENEYPPEFVLQMLRTLMHDYKFLYNNFVLSLFFSLRKTTQRTYVSHAVIDAIFI